MQIFIETERLIMREILPSDAEGMFALDSDPAVHTFLGNAPVTTIGQSRDMISNIRQQYIDFGTGRWAVTDKQDNSFMGWSGLKFISENINGHNNFHELGYRFLQKYWGKGIATEASKAIVNHAFEK